MPLWIKDFFFAVYTATRFVWAVAGLVLVALFLLFGRNNFTFYTAMPALAEEGPKTGYKKLVAQRRRWTIKVPADFNYRAHRFYDECSSGRNCRGPQTQRRADQGPSTLEVFGHADDGDRLVFAHRGPTRIKLELSSDLGQPVQSKADVCVADPGWMSHCGPEAEDCGVFLTFQGWPVIATVARTGLYREPERVCRIVRQALHSWTVRIDDRGPEWSGQ